MRAAIYARSSLDYPHTVDQQTDRLRAVAIEREWAVVQEFTDRPNSVRKGLDRRPGQDALINAIRDRRVDVVCVSSICRLGKSSVDLISLIETCRVAGVSVWAVDQQIDALSDGFSLFRLNELLALHLRQARRGR